MIEISQRVQCADEVDGDRQNERWTKEEKTNSVIKVRAERDTSILKLTQIYKEWQNRFHWGPRTELPTTGAADQFHQPVLSSPPSPANGASHCLMTFQSHSREAREIPTSTKTTKREERRARISVCTLTYCVCVSVSVYVHSQHKEYPGHC